MSLLNSLLFDFPILLYLSVLTRLLSLNLVPEEGTLSA